MDELARGHPDPRRATTEHALERGSIYLRDYGNTSNATVLFVLERFLKSREHGVFPTLGAGFSAEHVFFRC